MWDLMEFTLGSGPIKDMVACSKKDQDSIISGARIDVDETKDDPRDFALWKFSSAKPTWTSPSGKWKARMAH